MTQTFDLGVNQRQRELRFKVWTRSFKRRRDAGELDSVSISREPNRTEPILCAHMFRRAAASLVSTASSSSTTTTLRRPSEVLLGSVSTRDGVAARSASTLCVHLSTIPCFFSYAFGVIVFIACDDDDDGDDDDDDVSLIKRSIIHSIQL
jgi:hypothetical protein